jgi:nucleoside-diphosphate-sugar epimerase
MTKLITGGTGYIGAELARILAGRGEEVVLFDIAISRYRIEDIENKVKIVRGDVGNWSEVFSVIKDNHISEIYHLGSMLTYLSEENPWASFQSNVVGTYNVLEAARLFGVNKVMFTSTLGTFGLDFPGVITDTSLQRPITMYGCGKLYGEGLGRFYRNKFGLDFRSVRFAHMIGPNVCTPGHWAPPMIEDAISGRANECLYGDPNTVISMIYVRDAARAADMVLQAPVENIKMMNYNVTGVPKVVSAKELETLLSRRFPGFRVFYGGDKSVAESVRGGYSAMKEFNDNCASQEWGWKAQYATPEEITDVFQQDLKRYPRRYGLA